MSDDESYITFREPGTLEDDGAGPRLPLTRRRLLGAASAVAAGTASSWLVGCVPPKEEPWADGTFWSDGTGWIEERGWW